VARRRAVSTRALHWHALLVSIGVPQRLAVVCRGRLSALLVQRLICSRSDLQHATAVVSRRHFVGLKNLDVACVSTLQGHSKSVTSVAFHPSQDSSPYLATGSHDSTVKLWLLNADCSAPTCVSTIQTDETKQSVHSVAFHPSAPYLVTGNCYFRRNCLWWLLNADCSAATCVSTLQGHSRGVNSVAFHPSAPYLATGSSDNTAKLWR
jgi:WD40 repeat protein